MKIFITGINTELGYHLVETLRNDHLLLDEFSLISGTISSEVTFAFHESIHRSFDFDKERDQAVKCAVDSDVLIVDIRNNPRQEVEFILKALKHYNRKNEIKVIGISNYMTWSNAKPTDFTKVPHDKEELLEFTINKEKWNSVPLAKEDYALRSPHPMFVYNYLLEEQILQLKNHKKLIKPIIICTGFIYGKSGMDLSEEIENAIECVDSQIMDLKNKNLLSRDNKLSYVHVDRLLETIENFVYKKEQSSEYLGREYIVLCENEPKSIFEIVQNLHELCGHLEFDNQTKRDNEVQNNEHSEDENSTKRLISEILLAHNKKLFSFIINLYFSNATTEITENQEEIATENNQVNLINEFAKVIINEFSVYHEFSLKHFIFPEELLQHISSNHKEADTPIEYENNLNFNHKNVVKKLLQKYLLLDQNKVITIREKLIENGEISPENLVNAEEEKKKSKTIAQKNEKRETIKREHEEIFFPEIIKKFLTENINSNFVISIKSELIRKMLELLKEEHFSELKDMNFTLFTAKSDESIGESLEIIGENIKGTIEIFSSEFFEITGLSNLENLESKMENKELESVKEPSELEKIGERTNISAFNEPADSEETKVNLLSQYLLDNVVVYLAEAKLKLKQKRFLKQGQKFEGKENLKLFIQELKEIKKREEKQCENEEDEEKES